MRNLSPEDEKRIKDDSKHPDRLRKRWFYIAGGAAVGWILITTLVWAVVSSVVDTDVIVFAIGGIVVGGWLGDRWFKKKSKS